MLHACAVCGALSKTKRCPTHGGDAAPRNGSTRAWRKVRAEVLERDDYRCRYCGEGANTVDHITPVARGGAKLDKANLVGCCSDCNARKGDCTPAEAGMTLRSTHTT